MWRVELPDLFMLPGMSFNTSIRNAIDRYNEITRREQFNIEDINLRVVEVTEPHITFDKGEVGRNNGKWFVAKQNEMGDFVIEIEEYEDGLTLEYLNTWKDLMVNENGTYNPPVFYKRDINFFKISSLKANNQGNTLDVHKRTLKGCFVNSISDVSYSYDSNDIVRYSVTFSVDSSTEERLRPNITPVQQEIFENELSNSSEFVGLDRASSRRILESIIGSVRNNFF